MPHRQESTRHKESTTQYLSSFGWMLMLTAVAFLFVGTGYFPTRFTLIAILILAVIQGLFQFITFMHLDRRHQLVILFLISGLGLSVIFALGIWLM
ncbi:cytochrome B6 [Kroppenstedtia pulmonis]|uniref:Cytochrome B6 n=1 Tax=Kroppenstedtia pulmonis TaxID=1380685 RepID=A0A7D4BIE7_9BACL|nr:cytochrome C oxidase subunit IV family protein [Kroppenstedtia pulmonis]QKG83570.1 cytochrome B6 [Kroppenstedtia pulmonis]